MKRHFCTANTTLSYLTRIVVKELRVSMQQGRSDQIRSTDDLRTVWTAPSRGRSRCFLIPIISVGGGRWGPRRGNRKPSISDLRWDKICRKKKCVVLPGDPFGNSSIFEDWLSKAKGRPANRLEWLVWKCLNLFNTMMSQSVLFPKTVQ